MRGTPEERFLVKVRKGAECWQWIGAIQSGGYGNFWAGGRVVKSHRWSYEQYVGPIPEGLDLDHTCRNRRCVNPDHLEPVTGDENKRRSSWAFGRHDRCRSGLHRVSPDTWLTQSQGRVHRCPECRAASKTRRQTCAA